MLKTGCETSDKLVRSACREEGQRSGVPGDQTDVLPAHLHPPPVQPREKKSFHDENEVPDSYPFTASVPGARPSEFPRSPSPFWNQGGSTCSPSPHRSVLGATASPLCLLQSLVPLPAGQDIPREILQLAWERGSLRASCKLTLSSWPQSQPGPGLRKPHQSALILNWSPSTGR